jgi:hypothetical protein
MRIIKAQKYSKLTGREITHMVNSVPKLKEYEEYINQKRSESLHK